MPTKLREPANTPLDAVQAGQLDRLITSLNPHQLQWVGGYLTGLAAGLSGLPAAGAVSNGASAAGDLPALTVLFGSQTGNAESVAADAAREAEQRGFQVTLLDMADCTRSKLQQAANLLVVVSTYGEGDPPDRAEALHELLHRHKAPPLENCRFAVLALGDSSYELFCKTGRDFDARLEALGAERIHPRADCDLDYEAAAEVWIEAVLAKFSEHAPAVHQRAATVIPFGAAGEGPAWSKMTPFHATVFHNICLSGRGSSKKVRHIELSLEGSGIEYEPGDALGIVPQNSPALVDELIERLQLDPEASVKADGSDTTLREALLSDYEVTTITRPFLERYAALADAPRLRALLAEENAQPLRDYLHGRHLIDVVETFPVRGVAPAEFIATLRKLPPRLYSIASSHRASPGEVHLTVAAVRYASHGRDREGVASTFLADRLSEGDTVPVYLQPNPNFRLPEPSAPIIMIGPGTGVAPFRAFLYDRETQGAEGRNWLFFGDRNFLTDFLYQAEWLNWRKRGLLARIDVAFSRDSDQKVYVQDRMRESSRALYGWLQEGAHLYVCGDAARMAVDVHNTLVEIVRREGGLSEDRALDYLKELQRERRYQRDVY